MQQRARSKEIILATRLARVCAGFFEVEVLAATLLLGILLAVFSMGLSQALKLHLAARQELETRMLEGKLDYFLGKIVAGLDSHRFDLPVIIHQPGELRFTDGSPNQVMQSTQHAPALNSQALSGMKIESSKALYITALTHSGNSLTVNACSHYRSNPGSLIDYRVFMGISSEGFYELSGRARGQGGKPGCYQIDLTSGRSISVSQPSAQSLYTVRALLPVESHYTVYLSVGKQLRFISHANEVNLENQPILDLNAEYSLQVRVQNWNALSFFELDLLKDQAKVGQVVKNNLIAREDSLNFLLNRL